MGTAGTILLIIFALGCILGFIAISRASLHPHDFEQAQPLRDGLFIVASTATSAAIGSLTWHFTDAEVLLAISTGCLALTGFFALLRYGALWSKVIAFLGLPFGHFLGLMMASPQPTNAHFWDLVGYHLQIFWPFGYGALLLLLLAAVIIALLRKRNKSPVPTADN